MHNTALLSVLGLLFALASPPAVAEIVPGEGNPWLAGMPPGSSDNGSDGVPAQSPLEATTIDVTEVAAFSASAVGGVNFIPGCSIPPNASCHPPDGTFSGGHAGPGGVSNGIANLIAPYSSLVGVFLDDNQPDTTGAPPGLSFDVIGLDFGLLSPVLKQPFFIGDGQTATGQPQLFRVPAGATRLFLGTHDGFGWFNNSGQFDVDLMPVGDGLPSLFVGVVYSTESIVSGPLSFGLTSLPPTVTATIALSGFTKVENVVADLSDVSAFSLRFGDGLWTELTSFSLVTDGAGEVTTLTYATTGITTPSVVANPVLNGSFSATIEGTDIASGLELEYAYGDSAQTLVAPAATTTPVPVLPGAALLGFAALLALTAARSLDR